MTQSSDVVRKPDLGKIALIGVLMTLLVNMIGMITLAISIGSWKGVTDERLRQNSDDIKHLQVQYDAYTAQLSSLQITMGKISQDVDWMRQRMNTQSK